MLKINAGTLGRIIDRDHTAPIVWTTDSLLLAVGVTSVDVLSKLIAATKFTVALKSHDNRVEQAGPWGSARRVYIRGVVKTVGPRGGYKELHGSPLVRSTPLVRLAMGYVNLSNPTNRDKASHVVYRAERKCAALNHTKRNLVEFLAALNKVDY